MTREEAIIQVLRNHIEALEETIKALEQETCEDAISRQTVLEYIEGSDAELGHGSENELVCQDIKEFPSVTPQLKSEVFDKIRAEINGKYRVILKGTPKDDWAVRWNDCVDEVLQIIDKYKAESEE